MPAQGSVSLPEDPLFPVLAIRRSRVPGACATLSPRLGAHNAASGSAPLIHTHSPHQVCDFRRVGIAESCWTSLRKAGNPRPPGFAKDRLDLSQPKVASRKYRPSAPDHGFVSTIG